MVLDPKLRRTLASSSRGLSASAAGLTLVAATFVGLAIGYLLDRVLPTRPWLTIAFLVIGIIAGFVSVWRMARAGQEPAPKDDGDSCSRRD